MPEDARPDTFVAHVIVTDADSGDGGRFACSLSPPSVGDRFRLQATHDDREFHVVTSDQPLDREQVDRCASASTADLLIYYSVPAVGRNIAVSVSVCL